MWQTRVMPDSPPPDDIQVRALWPEGLAESAQVANQFVVANDITGTGGVYVLLGHLAAPVFVDAEHARQRLAQLGAAVTIQPRGAFFMTRQSAEQLRDVLVKHLGPSTEASPQ